MGFSSLLLVHLIIGSFSSLIILFVSLLLFRSYHRIKIQSTIVFSIGTVFIFIWAAMSTFYPIASHKNVADIMYIIGVISSYLGMFGIFIFLELIRSEEINNLRLFFLSALFGAICFLLVNKIPAPIGFAMPYKQNFGYYAAAQPPFLVAQVGFIVTVAVEFTVTTIEMIKKSDTKKRRTQSIVLLIGSSIAFYGAMIALVVVELVFVPSLVLLITALGFFFAAISFIMDPYVAYLLPYDVSLLVVVNSAGVPVYSHYFTDIEINEELFSGAVKAITTLMQETLKTEESVQYVRVGSVKLVIELKEHVSAFIITNRESKVLKQGLGSFLEKFIEKFRRDKLVSEGFVITSEFKEAQMLVENYLGFLKGSSRTPLLKTKV